ncbi:N5-glutamine S-adenosyl-L-methionine-dependent methyltransferase [Ligilactobacillus salitolerans]|uniref:Release factor glutamine methyltransferase n=1 Tax=Ligilactobacillus salitolerans TaxID=1808352 RepID=A0A401IR49_9LACO|nr:peptide chain release factor N(5)-glutamine methyltransferase [Ligilactobacillus salitolerans]GBG94001.1 N5-glutamine S-adenosyl-L-methionine-dependent methyltransferase [Ligilactobacillus salitolerans]
MSNYSFFEAQKWAFSYVKKYRLEKAAVDLLLCGEMGYSTTELLVHLRDEMPVEHWQNFRTNVELYCQGWPPQYLLGQASFYGMRLKVTPDVLIPRTETEELVDWILEDNGQRAQKVADIGTGSGAIGLALKSERPEWQVTLTDISDKALSVAQTNAELLHLPVEFCQGDMLAPLPDNNYDIIVCNPPYIARTEAPVMDQSVIEHEPHLALFAAEKGLAMYRKLSENILSYVHPGAKLYLEIGYHQGASVTGIFEHKFPSAEVTLKTDMYDNERMVRVIFE